MRTWVLFLLSVATLLMASTRAQAESISELNERLGGAVFKLVLRDAYGAEVGSGTGWVVAPGVIATNAHVVDDAAAVQLVGRKQKKLEAQAVLISSEGADLALLSVKGALPPPIPRAPVDPKAGTRVVIIGSPLGLAGSVSEGIVAAVRMDSGVEFGLDAKEPLMQMTASISPGSSGSPVLDAEGRVVGVAVGLVTTGSDLYFAIPVSRLHALVAQLPVDTPERVLDVESAGASWAIARNVLISVVFFGLLALGLRRL